jgi:hypothetical protein
MEEGLGITKDMAQLSADFVFEDNDPQREHWQRVKRTKIKSWGKESEGYQKVGAPLIIIHYRCTNCGYLESYAPSGDQKMS